MQVRLRSIFSFAPVFCGLVTYGIYRLFFIEAGINGIGNDLAVIHLERRSADVLGGVDSILGLLTWGVTGTFFVLAFLGGVAVLLHILYGALSERTDKNRYVGFAAGLGAAIAIGLLSLSGNPFAANSLNGLLVESYRLNGIEDAIILLYMFMPMVLAVTVLLMASSWATLTIDERRKSDSGLTLRNQFRSINTMLFVGAIVLVAGVVHADAIHRLPSVLMSNLFAETWNEMIGALSASSGAIWTLLLLGIYLPSIVVLRLRVRALAMESVEERTPEHLEKWLSSHGLTVRFPQLIAQFGAIVSPFLIGGPASPLVGLFGG